jgi:transmembrane E3 ubiquitin-protein ligase
MSAAAPPQGRRADESNTPTTNNPRPQRGSITSLLFLTFVFFLMSNHDGGDDFTARNHYKDTLSSLEWQLSNYSAWLNGSQPTNFTLVRPPSHPQPCCCFSKMAH